MNNRFVAAARRRKFTAFVLTLAFTAAVSYVIIDGGKTTESWSEYLPETVQEWLQNSDAQDAKAVKTKSKGA